MSKTKEINVICVGDLRYRFLGETINYFDLDFSPDVIRIDFKDGSFVEFMKRNVIAIEHNKEEVQPIPNSMDFPSDIYGFLIDYSFKDEEKVYTNGSLLIPTFRVKQALEHYFGEKESADDRQRDKRVCP